MTDIFNDLASLRWDPPGIPEEPVPTDAETEIMRSRKARRAAKLKAAFCPPYNCADVFTWHRVGPNCLVLMLVLKRWRTLKAEPPYIIGDQLLDRLEMGPWTRDRALAALEKAGLIRVDRHRGRLPRILVG